MLTTKRDVQTRDVRVTDRIMFSNIRDWLVDGRLNKIYLYIFPAIIVLQADATHRELANPNWWQAASQAILG